MGNPGWTPTLDVVGSHERVVEVMDAVQAVVDLRLATAADLTPEQADRTPVKLPLGHLLVLMLLAIDGYNAGVALARQRGDIPMDLAGPGNTQVH